MKEGLAPMLRSGRFRHRLLDEVFLRKYSGQAHACLQPFLALWIKGALSDVEMAGIYIWVFSFLRRPQDFFGGPHSAVLAASKDELCGSQASRLFSCQEALQLLQETLPEELFSARSLRHFANDRPFIEQLYSHSLRSVPFSVSRALARWQQGLYPLKLVRNVPSADEVLLMQCQGVRCVSMLTELEEIQNFVLEGRDMLGFILHDLIHADHFFVNPENAQAQIYFSQKLWELRHHSIVTNMLHSDPRFVEEFHYLMADMNTVPLHLLKSLKTVFLAFFKRRDGLLMTSSLSPSSEQEFESLFESLLKPWAFSPAAMAAVHRLNTPNSLGVSDSIILDQELRPKTDCSKTFSL